MSASVSPSFRPLAVTGYGVISPYGVGTANWEKALSKVNDSLGRDSETRLDFADTSAEGVFAARPIDWDAKAELGKKGHRSLDPLTKYLIAAAKHAITGAALKNGDELVLEKSRVGVASATAYGSLDAIAELNRVAELEAPRYINPQRFPNTVINAAAGYVSIWEGLEGPNTTVVDGNCGALDAVLVASTHLGTGRVDAMLVGGGEVASEPLCHALSRLGQNVGAREGEQKGAWHLGEGAAYLVVESSEHAESRAQKPIATIVGYGTSFDPPKHEGLLHASSRAVQEAIENALLSAGVEAGDIELVVPADSAVGPFKKAEKDALSALQIDARQLHLREAIGETFGASGVFGMSAAIATGKTTSTLALVISIGFYGNASAVLLRT